MQVRTAIGMIVGRLLFKEVSTVQIRELSSSFRLVSFASESLRNVAWEAGDKIQVYLPGRGMRTYTPMAWNSERGAAELLVYLHGTSPGAEWGRQLALGDGFQFFGPRRSIRGTDLADSIVLFGDETSFAVARALSDARRGGRVSCVFEVSDVAASSAALGALGLEGTAVATVERTPSERHLAKVADLLCAELAAKPDASLVMTGKAQSIQSLRATLKERNALRGGKVKAYWSVGKVGLD